MRAVGARASLLRQVQRAELAGVGLLAGFLASIAASAIGWGLARYVFDFVWTASPLGEDTAGQDDCVMEVAYAVGFSSGCADDDPAADTHDLVLSKETAR